MTNFLLILLVSLEAVQNLTIAIVMEMTVITPFFKKLVAECVETNGQISCDNCMRVIKLHTELLANP